jgi:hypothetical protein
MATLLSAPNEILLSIFRLACEDVRPLQKNRLTPAHLSLCRRPRDVAIQALAESVQLDLEGDGSVRGRLGRWLGKQGAWQHVRRLCLKLRSCDIARIPTILASSLPVDPATVKLAFHIWPAGAGQASASCHSFLPFANTLVHDIELSSDVVLRLDATPILQGFLKLGRLSVSNIRLDYVGPAVGILWTSLERFCDSSDLVSHQSDIVLRCPNLLSATLHAPSSPHALPELSLTLRELAISLDLVSTDQDIRQFEGLGRYKSLFKLAYDQLSLATNWISVGQRCPSIQALFDTWRSTPRRFRSFSSCCGRSSRIDDGCRSWRRSMSQSEKLTQLTLWC